MDGAAPVPSAVGESASSAPARAIKHRRMVRATSFEVREIANIGPASSVRASEGQAT